MKILMVGFDTESGSKLPYREMASIAKRNGAEWIMADTLVPPERKRDRLKRSSKQMLHKLRRLPPELWTHTAKALRKYMKDGKVDAVVCVDGIGEDLKEDSDIPVYTLLTDYSPEALSDKWDGYFVPHEDIRKKLLAAGVPNEKIQTVGMPLEEGFAQRMGRERARRYLGLPKDRKIYLVSSAGLSGEELNSLCKIIAQTEQADYMVAILVNRESSTELQGQIEDKSHVHFLIYSSKLNVYMEAANVLIAKPMGIVSAEAAAAGVPLVHLQPEDSREAENAAFFADREMSLKAHGLADAATKAKRLVDSKAMADRMRSRQMSNSIIGATQNIMNILLHREKKGKI